jgi:hypothetical protein
MGKKGWMWEGCLWNTKLIEGPPFGEDSVWSAVLTRLSRWALSISVGMLHSIYSWPGYVCTWVNKLQSYSSIKGGSASSIDLAVDKILDLSIHTVSDSSLKVSLPAYRRVILDRSNICICLSVAFPIVPRLGSRVIGPYQLLRLYSERASDIRRLRDASGALEVNKEDWLVIVETLIVEGGRLEYFRWCIWSRLIG